MSKYRKRLYPRKDCFRSALHALGYEHNLASRASRYEAYRKPSGNTNIYLGNRGALRVGSSVARSRSYEETDTYFALWAIGDAILNGILLPLSPVDCNAIVNLLKALIREHITDRSDVAIEQLRALTLVLLRKESMTEDKYQKPIVAIGSVVRIGERKLTVVRITKTLVVVSDGSVEYELTHAMIEEKVS